MSQVSYGALVNAVKNLEREVYRGRNNYPLPKENSIRIDMLVSEMARLINSIKDIDTIKQVLSGNDSESINKFINDGISTKEHGEDPVKTYKDILSVLKDIEGYLVSCLVNFTLEFKDLKISAK